MPIKPIDTVSPEAIALQAAIQLHADLLYDDGFAGYNGTKEAFDRLYQELFVIARDEASSEVDPVDQVVNTFYDYQSEIVEGQRDVGWYL